MKVLYVVQRYGAEIIGGSEAACRAFAHHLLASGHEVSVLTSCAIQYTDWANEHPPGTFVDDGVTVHRLPVRAPRTDERFGPIHHRLLAGPRPVPMFQQHRWAKLMGPDINGLSPWLRRHGGNYDVVIFMTYLYASTSRGLTAIAGRVPTILQPTVHDEPFLWFGVYDGPLRLADHYLYFTIDERNVLERRLGRSTPGDVIGMGIDLHEPADPTAMRRRLGLGEDPYVVYVGRVDPSKGTNEAVAFFGEYKRRNPGPLRFVLVGEAYGGYADHVDVIRTGFLDESDKRAVLAGALALLQPSYFESFSIVLCESWVQGRPAIVQAASSVLAGQARRSGAALPYRGFAELEACLDLLLADRALGDRMGRNGRAFVEEHYRWPVVIAGVERAIHHAQNRFATRATR